MNRRVERRRNLPAFSIGLGELEVLWNRIIAVFGPGEPDGALIKISLQSEELEFRMLDELHNNAELKGRVTKFSLHFYQGRRILNVFPGSLFNAVPFVFAQGETEAWCAGAVEVVYSFLQSHRLWYHWFVSWAVGIFISVLLFASSALALLLPNSPPFPRWIVLAWLSSLVALSVLHLARAILLPSSVLRVTNEEGFFRRHVAELSLVVALISAVLTVVGWFFRR
jgi:hypothetical protein